MHYAKSHSAREKFETHLSIGSARIKLDPDYIREAGTFVAMFPLRGDKEFADRDLITWEGGPVLTLAVGLDNAAIDAVVRAYREGYEHGEAGGQNELRREFRHLLGLEG